ncbi:MAG TPA: glycosyltransferase family 4 protein [Opitutaceae bacterium]|nr:glycosyltransferase family 4 protein [Opitutaceae bacterium]
MRVLLAHPGTQHARRLAGELQRLGLLGEFWTGLALAEGGAAARLARLLAGVPRLQALGNRVVPGVPGARLRRVPWNEVIALARLDRGADSLRTLHERNRRFQEAIPQRSLERSDAVVGFDTSAWDLGRRARDLGRAFYLDRTIAHPAAYARIQQQLHRDFPAWCAPATPRPDWLARAEQDEHELARRIVVGGRFAQSTLLEHGIPAERIRVNPYGVDWEAFAAAPRPSAPRPLRFLFLGSHLARKGLPVLLAAWQALGASRRESELWLAGHCHPQVRPLIPDLPGLKLLGPRPHAEVPALFAQVDVFVLPSYFEGFGLVLLEALAAGVPFIATPHTGAVDFPEDPALGRIVPAGSVEALVAALRAFIESPPNIAGVRAAATPLAARFSWRAYGDRWAGILRES